MFKLAKYYKPFIGMILLAIALLFAQAMCDLALPDYMSDIVNTGIQQGGIESAVPDAIRKSEYDKLSVFFAEESKAAFDRSYLLKEAGKENSNADLKKYPALEQEPVYLLQKAEGDDFSILNRQFAKAFLIDQGFSSLKEEAKDGFIDVNGKQIPADTDLYAMFAVMPEEQRSVMLENMESQLEAMEESMLLKSAIPAVKTEYEAIGMNASKIQSKYIVHIGVTMLALSLSGALAAIMVTIIASRTAAGVSRNLRRKVFTKVESFSNTEFDTFSTASLITRTTNDITQVQMLTVMIIRMAFYAPIMGIGGIVRAVGKSASMTWIIALSVVVLIGLIMVIFSIAMPKFKKIQKLVDKLNLITRESLSGMMVIRAFNTQRFEEKRFDDTNQELTKTNLFVNRVIVVMFPMMTLIMNLVTLIIVWVGAGQIEASTLQVGDMMAFIQYAMQIIMSFLMLSMMFIMIPRASVSAERVAEVLRTKPVIQDPENPKHFSDGFRAEIEFKNVSFRYPGAEENVLENISFKAVPGQTTAFIGSTGSGKSTLINLIPRFYDVTEGEILIDGINIKDVSQHELRDKIGYIPQKGSLFSGTIASNLHYANEDASEEELQHAVEIAQATHFISKLPDGLDSDISQGGSNVSGGQKQRLSIARALVKKPDIYIFDDSFSALDFKTDANLRRALKPETENNTVLIVAQRISTIKNAEQIIVLNEGKIEGIGTHRELMQSCETYQEIALSQLSKEELA